MAEKSVSARKPRAFARAGSRFLGQPATMRAIVSSGSLRMSFTAFSPATCRSASICSPTVAETPGRLSVRRAPRSAVSISAARRRKPTAERGEACQCRTSSPTGRIASLPESGSRMIPEKNPDAALFGAPGRTQIVGSLRPIPSKNPRLRIVGEQQVADRLLRTVTRQRRGEELIADRLGERRAEDRDRGGEDEPRAIGAAGEDMLPPDRLEQGLRSAEIDGVALVEIRLRLARHDRSEQENHVRPARGQFRRDIGGGDVAGLADDRKGGLEGRGRDNIGEMRLVDRLAREATRRAPASGRACVRSCRPRR